MDGALFLNSKVGSNAGSPTCLLEKHLILNWNRLRTFEDARLEVVTYVEAKFGLRIRDSKPSERVLMDTQIPWMLMRSVLSRLARERSSSPRDGYFKFGDTHFQPDCNARKGTGKQSSGKGKQSKSLSKSEGKERNKESKGESKGKSKGSNGYKGAKGSYKGKTSKTGLSGLEKPETREKLRNSGDCTDVSH